MSITLMARAARLRAIARDLECEAIAMERDASPGIITHDGSEPQEHAAPMCADDDPPSRPCIS